MTGDHINKYLFNGTLPFLFEAGRLALPLFIFVLAFNLARPGALDRGAYVRTLKRLLIFGSIATIPFMALGGLRDGWWPLNVLFTLFGATTLLYMLDRRQHLAAGIVFLVAGTSVEFWWPAIGLAVAVWLYCRKPTWAAGSLVALTCASLWLVNRNFWALAALPIIIGAGCCDLRIPRTKWVFYAYYPLHLTALWLIRIPMASAGYLFFT